ncbi:MAG: tyrosine-type recombinase/integrase [Bacteroidetes bacterium]|nr:tyrosine-type recombinase/integrase [Bacteroidota bacterium]
MTIEKAITIYLDWKQSHTTVAYDRYRVRLEQFLNFIMPKSCLQDITGDDVVAYHKHMEGHYSLSTISYSARILKNFFAFWQGRRETNFNPKEIIPIRFTSADKDIVTHEDFRDMDDLIDTEYLPDLQKKLVLNLLWDTGMRVSELCDLKLSGISEQGSNGLRTAKVRTRKSMRYNLVVWGKDTNELLNSYLGIRLCMEKPSDLLLINPRTGKPFTTRTIQRWINELASLAMLDKIITPHSFRHGKANYILDQGGTVRDVSAILRHVKPESSFHYLQLSVKRYQEVAEKYLTTA